MVDIRDIVNVQISLESQAVQESNFGTGLAFGATVAFIERVRAYTSASQVIQDGIDASDPLYRIALAYFSASPSARVLLIGRRQVDSVTVTVGATINAGQLFTIAVNGGNYTYTAAGGDTAAQVEAGLKTLIDAGAGGSLGVTTTATGSGLIIAATTPGTAFTVQPAAGLTLVQPVAADTVTNDITVIEEEAIRLGGFYGLIMADRTPSDVLEAAANTEASRYYRIFGTTTSDANALLAASTSDLLSLLKAAGYNRTFAIWHQDAATYWPEATWMGDRFTSDPGSSTWAFKRLPGIPVTELTTTQSLVIRKNFGFGKNGNVLVTVRGARVSFEGTMASGEYIDLIRGRDWLEDAMTVAVFSRIVNAPKIPYTDGGIAIIRSEMDKTLERAVDRGFLSPPILNPDTNELEPSYVINVPRQANIPFNDKANRVLNDVSFRAVAAGAIHHANINGVVTVGTLN